MSRRKYASLILGVFFIGFVLFVPLLDPSDAKVAAPESGDHHRPDVIGAEPKEAATIRVALSVSPSEYDYWVKESRQFELHHSGLHIDIRNFPDGQDVEGWKATLAAGDSFDVLLLDTNYVMEYAVAGYLLPTDNLFAGNEISDQLEALTEPLRWNGSFWGIPLDCNPMLVVWQNARLKEAGQAEPPVNWDMFAAMLDKLHHARPSLASVNLRPSEAKELAAWLGAFDGYAAKAAMQPFGVKEQKQLRAMGQQQFLSQLDPAANREELERRFDSGKLVSAVMSWTDFNHLDEGTAARLRLSAKPGTLVPSASGGRSFVVSAYSDSAEQAGEWIRAMTASTSQAERLKELGTLPARKSAYTISSLTAELQSIGHDLLALLSGPASPSDPGWSKHWDSWLAALKPFANKPFKEADAERLIQRWNHANTSGA